MPSQQDSRDEATLAQELLTAMAAASKLAEMPGQADIQEWLRLEQPLRNEPFSPIGEPYRPLSGQWMKLCWQAIGTIFNPHPVTVRKAATKHFKACLRERLSNKRM